MRGSLVRCSQKVVGWGCATHGRLGLRDAKIVADLHEPGTAVYTPATLDTWEREGYNDGGGGGNAVGFRSVSCGSGHSVILTESGEVWTFGMNFAGQLGHGDTKDVLLPKRVEDLPPCRAIAAGETHTLAVSNEGFVYGFGSGRSGQLGLGKIEDRVTRPALITALVEVGERAVKVAAGKSVSAVISESGNLFTFGTGAASILGHGDTRQKWSLLRPFAPQIRGESTPRLVQALKGQPVVTVAFGLSSAMAILRTGEVIGWGTNTTCNFGDGVERERLEPKECAALSTLGMQKIVHGTTHSLGITIAGDVYSWGNGDYGALGNTDSPHKHHPYPERIEWFREHVASVGRVTDIAAGMFFSVAATEGGVTSWGQGVHGKLGHGNGNNTRKPDFILDNNNQPMKVETVSSGLLHTLAITTNT